MVSVTRPNRRSTWRSAPVTVVAVIWLACGGCAPSRPARVIYQKGDERVYYVDPNVPACAPWPAVVISRRRYLDLVRAEMVLLDLRTQGQVPAAWR